MDLHKIALEIRRAFLSPDLQNLSLRNQALLAMAKNLQTAFPEIQKANEEDLLDARKSDLAAPLLKRLRFDEAKLHQVTQGLEDLARLPDPIGATTLARELSPGLKLYRVTCPIGVIGVIFESRPDALVQIASLCLKSGNTVLLKGGREAMRTNACLTKILQLSAEEVGLPGTFAQLLESREDVQAMLSEDTLIDLIIPRGSASFVQYIKDHSRIPVLGHADGICHVYLDRDADPDTALKVALDSKVQNVSVCNACETLLVHQDRAEELLPRLAEEYRKCGVTLRCTPDAARYIPDSTPATEDDWKTEYLDLILSVKVVSSLEEAIQHINTYGSHHTDCIVTENREAASIFLKQVDSAGVYVNVSTRFADGFVYGFGAEVGISTGKIHARGPMGLDGLTTYKYKLIGSGQTMQSVRDGEIQYTHRDLNEVCPL
ncbi:MAG: glutamate-5-semialdehyde dehydrogenase [Clostridia bacterium]|nr:glutamate-5-semialdehyde dehydrogenase [Clostridia bacterium]